jgi:hypothetical protein
MVDEDPLEKIKELLIAIFGIFLMMLMMMMLRICNGITILNYQSTLL